MNHYLLCKAELTRPPGRPPQSGGREKGVGTTAPPGEGTSSLENGGGFFPSKPPRPILHLTRPSELYYYQGAGLKVLYGFTYKYITVEHFLGEATGLHIGYPLADELARCYSQAWYPGDEPLSVFTDRHTKAHWTKQRAHSGHITMLERVMPGTKQLLINGPDGHLVGGWNYTVNAHFCRVLEGLHHRPATPGGSDPDGVRVGEGMGSRRGRP